MNVPNDSTTDLWVHSIRETVDSYRRMIDGTVSQLSDEELHQKPGAGVNSVTILLRHLGGNLKSRWTDFLITDGEKPDRNRDAEFEDREGNRESLLDYFDSGWSALIGAIDSLDETNLNQTITIRGEPHSIPQAMARSIMHLSYHVGQIVMIARMVHVGEWNWLTIAPGSSAQFNTQTWGSSASRGVLQADGEAKE